MALILRIINNSASKPLIWSRSIMTSNQKLQKVMEDLQKNPYYEKYAKKIAVMQKTSPEEFVQKIEEKEREESKAEMKSAERRYAPVLNPKEPLKGSTTPSEKKLEDIFKIDLVHEKTKEEIIDIWQKYHIQKDVIAAVIPKETYEKIEERLSTYPTFLFPLPRSQGYEFVMSQGSGSTVHFTTLLCYQVHKENAPECLSMVHYKELLEEKGIVLMRGEFDKNVLDSKEAQCLANQFQMYYGQDYPAKQKLLDDFTNQAGSFKHMDLITEFENIKLV